MIMRNLQKGAIVFGISDEDLTSMFARDHPMPTLWRMHSSRAVFEVRTDAVTAFVAVEPKLGDMKVLEAMIADGIGHVVLAGLAFLRKEEASYGIAFRTHVRSGVFDMMSGCADDLDVCLDSEMSAERYEYILEVHGLVRSDSDRALVHLLSDIDEQIRETRAIVYASLEPFPDMELLEWDGDRRMGR
jgi:hypothetical protein